MEINTNPNYLNNVQNQNAQGANSATAENVVEENLFDGNEANATQNNAVSQDYQNAEMLNTFVAAFTAVMAPFMQMMTQFMGMMAQQMNPQPTQTTKEAPQSGLGKSKSVLKEVAPIWKEYQETQNDKALLQEYQETPNNLKRQKGRIPSDQEMLAHIQELLQDENKLIEQFNDMDRNHNGFIDASESSIIFRSIDKYREFLKSQEVHYMKCVLANQ